ncbi:MAG: bacterial regulatory s, tetR family protein [Hydrocarboniphaga sp.]|uniref:TetR/AcrR family transcriptional regulator n=1 Tax=Hydrocarboniphaga sp. TaxID=2033016 RepID=UPI0026030FFF|nr:TetR/AcrR family transcriptional regulator [Hydrocarboniphaga sp.]MDB5970128.1 bacterial regulatory s, tetR family protein [Hydrocarboniphaga sp.]
MENPLHDKRDASSATSTRGRGRPISMSTREAILDSAESLFAGHGYNGVSISDITGHAGVQKSLATHHFGSKEELFRAVLNRRAGAYVNDVQASLDQVMAATAGAPARVDDLLRALATPIMSWLGRDAKSRAYVQLLAQIGAIPGQEALLVPYRERYTPVTRAYIEQLRRAVPTLSKDKLNWAFYFVEAAFVHIVTASCLLDRETRGLSSLSDHQTTIDRLVEFYTAGFLGTEAGCETPAKIGNETVYKKR